MRIISKLKNRMKMSLNNKGMTMVETIVSFVVLVIVLAGLYSMVKFSSQLSMRAVDTGRLLQSFSGTLYRNKESIGTDEAGGYVKVTEYNGKNDGSNMTGFMLILDKNTTNVANNFGSGYSSTSTGIDSAIRLPNVDAKGYVSVNPIADPSSASYENILAPKVMKFSYHFEY